MLSEQRIVILGDMGSSVHKMHEVGFWDEGLRDGYLGIFKLGKSIEFHTNDSYAFLCVLGLILTLNVKSK